MEEISVKGEKYLKASVIAENFGYTSDYIGQLCRSGQVKATLVGRSWYVNEDSVRKHRKGRYRSTSTKSKEHLREAVEVKSVNSEGKKSAITNTKYENDESDLIPTIKINKVTEENINENKDISDEEITPDEISEIEKTKVEFAAVQRPVFKTIPNFQKQVAYSVPKKIVAENRPQKNQVNKEPKSSQFSYLTAIAVSTCFLIVTSALALGALGLEKRLVINENQQAMILYGFDTKVVVDNLKNIKF